jgi:hypothetical protein
MSATCSNCGTDVSYEPMKPTYSFLFGSGGMCKGCHQMTNSNQGAFMGMLYIAGFAVLIAIIVTMLVRRYLF